MNSISYIRHSSLFRHLFRTEKLFVTDGFSTPCCSVMCFPTQSNKQLRFVDDLRFRFAGFDDIADSVLARVKKHQFLIRHFVATMLCSMSLFFSNQSQVHWNSSLGLIFVWGWSFMDVLKVCLLISPYKFWLAWNREIIILLIFGCQRKTLYFLVKTTTSLAI